MDYSDTVLTLIVILQMATTIAVLKGRSSTAPKASTPAKTEEKEETYLKSILASKEGLSAYAFAKFKGDEDKAKKAVQKRLEKLTGETIEVPWNQ